MTYTLKNTQSERQRLEIQGLKLFGGPSLLDEFIHPGMKILDLGCGTGINSRYIADRCKDVAITAIDFNNARIVENQRSNTTPCITYMHGNAYDIPVDGDQFDLVFCRFLLMHLNDPQKAVDEMFRVTKRGGAVVAHEAIHNGVWLCPPRPTFERFLKIWIAKMAEKGQDASVGLKLNHIFREAGLTSVKTTIYPNSHSGDEELFHLYMNNWTEHLPSLADVLGEEFTEDDMNEMRNEVADISPNDFYIEMTASSCGLKP